MAPPKIAIVYYSTWGHIKTLADAEKAGIEKAGGTVDLYQIPETLSEDVLAKMYAPPKADVTVLEDPTTLEQYDGILFGIPTRYGNHPAQWRTFWDKTGKQWSSGGFYGKLAGVFLSTATLGGGQESTALATMSTFAHHGLIFVPLGYAKGFHIEGDLSEVHGGGPWGAGTFAASDGSRQVSAKEIELATIQGQVFYETVAKYTAGVDAPAKTTAAPAPAAAKGAAAPAPKPAANGSQSRPQQKEKEEKDSEGPCGLPSKCTIL